MSFLTENDAIYRLPNDKAKGSPEKERVIVEDESTGNMRKIAAFKHPSEADACIMGVLIADGMSREDAQTAVYGAPSEQTDAAADAPAE